MTKRDAPSRCAVACGMPATPAASRRSASSTAAGNRKSWSKCLTAVSMPRTTRISTYPPLARHDRVRAIIEGAHMPVLHIEHAITDLDTWVAAFNRFAEARKGAGVSAQRVHQPTDDDKYIYVDLEFDSVEAAASS